MHRLIKIFVVAVTLFAATAPCLCWLPMMAQEGCCRVEMEMKDCCCSTDAAMGQDIPSQHPALPSGEWLLPLLTCDAPGVFDAVPSITPSFSAKQARDFGMPLRSPPDLYVLHAAFLI